MLEDCTDNHKQVFSDIVAEIVDKRGVDKAGEKARFLQLQSDGPPVHPRMFHDDANVPAAARHRFSLLCDTNVRSVSALQPEKIERRNRKAG